MEINAQFDAESSKISEKIIFSCEHFELTHEDIAQLKKRKLIAYIQEDDLPDSIPCQVLIFIENFNKAKVMLFNPRFDLPPQVFENAFLNKDIIQRCKTNGGFRMEFIVPLHDR